MFFGRSVVIFDERPLFDEIFCAMGFSGVVVVEVEPPVVEPLVEVEVEVEVDVDVDVGVVVVVVVVPAFFALPCDDAPDVVAAGLP
jgi:hypothetical protein